MKTLVFTDWAPAFSHSAQSIAAVLVAVYVAGEQLGRFVHLTSEALGTAYACLLVGHRQAAQVTEQVAEQVAATWQGLPLGCLSVVELRTVARERGIKAVGDRRVAQARRADLLLALA